jgi:small subunit ribosomal protein S27Ae
LSKKEKPEKVEKAEEKGAKPAKEGKEAKGAKEEAKAPPTEVPAAEEAEVKEAKKPAKGKIKRKKRVGKKIFTLYKIEGESATRLRPFCERCGPGYFMADHGNRFACGHCGFTRYKVSETTE